MPGQKYLCIFAWKREDLIAVFRLSKNFSIKKHRAYCSGLAAEAESSPVKNVLTADWVTLGGSTCGRVQGPCGLWSKMNRPRKLRGDVPAACVTGVTRV